jgi:hypothetical protein
MIVQRPFHTFVVQDHPGIELGRHAKQGGGGAQLSIKWVGIAAGLDREKVHWSGPPEDDPTDEDKRGSGENPVGAWFCLRKLREETQSGVRGHGTHLKIRGIRFGQRRVHASSAVHQAMLKANTVLKKFATCTLAILLTATLLWGGCLSCANYFMLPSISTADCCAPTSHCKEKNKPAPSSQEGCRIQAVAPSKAGPIVPHTPVLFAHFTPVIVPVGIWAVSSAHAVSAPAVPPGNFSPPDLCLLHSVFRI